MHQEIMTTKLLVTSREAAKMLSISERTLWSLTKTELLNVVRIGRSVRYAVADIEEYIERGRRKPAESPIRLSSANKEH